MSAIITIKNIEAKNVTRSSELVATTFSDLDPFTTTQWLLRPNAQGEA